MPRADFAAVPLPNGQVLLIGGQTSASADTATVDVFNPATKKISAATPMKTARSGLTATLLQNGKVLVVGGSATPGGSPLTSAEIYDPAANTWTAAASMTRGRAHQAAVLLPNGRVLVAGGAVEPPGVSPAVWEVYDQGSNTWTSFEGGDARPDGPTATLLNDGRVLVDGGQTGTPPLDAFFDSTTARVILTPVPMLDESKIWATSALLGNGTVITAGGESSASPGGSLSSTEVFDPTPGTSSALGMWLLGPAMNTGHSHDSMTALKNGLVLIAGGRAGTQDPISVAELYDSVARRWWPAASLQLARGAHVAALLADG
ncbi:MAG TPA: kelch repeat-containing protein, partial [Candidatus Udaeobacter sp.]|nr:kelch repeat-containing protein [Candidatus Udaeobacter sp.]